MERNGGLRRREPNIWVPVLVIAAVLGLVVYFWPAAEKPGDTPPLQAPAPAPAEEDLLTPAPVVEEPQIRFPVPVPAQPEVSEAPEQITPQPSPVVDVGDDFIEEEFRHLYDEQKFGQLFLLKNIIRNLVVTIDNLTAVKLPQKFRFTEAPPGKFAVVKDAAGDEFMDPANYERYRLFLDLVDTADLKRFITFYVRYYPLFQQAYRDLGYPDRYFNDRFVAVLDHLQQAPEIRVPIKLVRPKVFYQFADPELEALSAGQKILIRIGPDQAARVKGRMAELRQALATLKKKN